MSNLRAAIDIGSNTVLLLILDGINEVVFEARVTSLGKNLDKEKKFEQQSMDDTYTALTEYFEICSSHSIAFSDVLITATEASRVARNAKPFFDKIKNELDGNIKKISGEQEAYFSSLGVVNGERLNTDENKELILMDIGGGSTELIKVESNPFSVLTSISLPLGSVRVSDWLASGEWETKKRELLQKFNLSDFKTSNLIGVAGTMTSLMNMARGNQDFVFTSFNESMLSYLDLKTELDKLTSKTPDELNKQFPFLGKRSGAILGGYKVCQFISEELGVEDFQISFKGLVHGVIFDKS